jgi:hypothetical protein
VREHSSNGSSSRVGVWFTGIANSNKTTPQHSMHAFNAGPALACSMLPCFVLF